MGRRPDQTQTTTQAIDPFIRAQQRDLYGRATDFVDETPFQAFPGGSRVAPLQPLQLAAQDFLSERLLGGGTGIAQAEQAAAIASGVAGGGPAPTVNPMMLSAFDVTAPSAAFAGDVTAERVAPGMVAAPGAVAAERVAGGDLLGGIGRYQDPFEQQVVDAALGDIDRARQLAVGDARSAATSAGAFGGSRSALVEAETNRAFADQAARTAAQLRSQGFERAAGLAESDATRGLQAGLANQGAGLTAGLANQANLREIGQFNASLGLDAARSNQAAAQQAALANQGRLQELAQFNASLGMSAEQANQAARAQIGIANQGAGLTAGLANQDAFLAGRNQQLQAAGLLSGAGGDIFNRTVGTGQALSGLGAQQQGQAQAELSDEVARFYEERGYPREQIEFLAQLLGGFPAGQTQTTTQPGGSRAAGALGGAASGAGAGFMFGGPPGALIGAGVGGLLGLF